MRYHHRTVTSGSACLVKLAKVDGFALDQTAGPGEDMHGSTGAAIFNSRCGGARLRAGYTD